VTETPRRHTGIRKRNVSATQNPIEGEDRSDHGPSDAGVRQADQRLNQFGLSGLYVSKGPVTSVPPVLGGAKEDAVATRPGWDNEEGNDVA